MKPGGERGVGSLLRFRRKRRQQDQEEQLQQHQQQHLQTQMLPPSSHDGKCYKRRRIRGKGSSWEGVRQAQASDEAFYHQRDQESSQTAGQQKSTASASGYPTTPGPWDAAAAKHFEVLGLACGASAVEVRTAFRRKALATHPDKGGSCEAFDRVESAYRSLCSIRMSMKAMGCDQSPDLSEQGVPKTPTMARLWLMKRGLSRSTWVGRLRKLRTQVLDELLRAKLCSAPIARAVIGDVGRTGSQRAEVVQGINRITKSGLYQVKIGFNGMSIICRDLPLEDAIDARAEIILLREQAQQRLAAHRNFARAVLAFRYASIDLKFVMRFKVLGIRTWCAAPLHSIVKFRRELHAAAKRSKDDVRLVFSCIRKEILEINKNEQAVEKCRRTELLACIKEELEMRAQRPEVRRTRWTKLAQAPESGLHLAAASDRPHVWRVRRRLRSKRPMHTRQPLSTPPTSLPQLPAPPVTTPCGGETRLALASTGASQASGPPSDALVLAQPAGPPSDALALALPQPSGPTSNALVPAQPMEDQSFATLVGREIMSFIRRDVTGTPGAPDAERKDGPSVPVDWFWRWARAKGMAREEARNLLQRLQDSPMVQLALQAACCSLASSSVSSSTPL